MMKIVRWPVAGLAGMVLICACGAPNPDVEVLKETKSPDHLLVMNEDVPQKGNWDFTPQTVWDLDAYGQHPFTSMAEVCLDDRDHVYILDIQDYRIHKLAPDGRFLFSIGSEGSGPGEFKMPYGMVCVGENLLVMDQGWRMHRFSQDGPYQETIRFGMGRSPSVMIDLDRYISFRENLEEAQQTVDLELYTISTNKSLRLARLPPDDHMVLQLGSGRGSATHYWRVEEVTPGQVYAKGVSHFYYARSDEYEIRKVDWTGREVMRFGIKGRDPLPLTAEAVEEVVGTMDRNVRTSETEKKMRRIVPKNHTLFDHIQTDERGFVYVFNSNLNHHLIKTVDIFSPQGQYLYRGSFSLSQGLEFKNPIILKHGFAYISTRNEEDEYSLMKVRLRLPQESEGD